MVLEEMKARGYRGARYLVGPNNLRARAAYRRSISAWPGKPTPTASTGSATKRNCEEERRPICLGRRVCGILLQEAERGARMGIHESGENYLETILLLQRQNGFVRSVDVAGALNYTKASISRAMRILKEQGFVEIARSGQITLTEEGRRPRGGHLRAAPVHHAVPHAGAGAGPKDRGRGRLPASSTSSARRPFSASARTSSRMTASGEPHGGKRGTAARAPRAAVPFFDFCENGRGIVAQAART